MSWPLFPMLIWIACSFIRIALNTYFDVSPRPSNPSLLTFFAKVDYVILWSFFGRSLLPMGTARQARPVGRTGKTPPHKSRSTRDDTIQAP